MISLLREENMDVCIGIVVIVNVTLMILQSQWSLWWQGTFNFA